MATFVDGWAKLQTVCQSMEVRGVAAAMADAAVGHGEPVTSPTVAEALHAAWRHEGAARRRRPQRRGAKGMDAAIVQAHGDDRGMCIGSGPAGGDRCMCARSHQVGSGTVKTGVCAPGRVRHGGYQQERVQDRGVRAAAGDQCKMAVDNKLCQD